MKNALTLEIQFDSTMGDAVLLVVAKALGTPELAQGSAFDVVKEAVLTGQAKVTVSSLATLNAQNESDIP